MMLRKATSRKIRLFDANYDDSSDEETVESVNHYQIDEYWQELPANISVKKILDNHRLLSFVAHAASIEFLYSSSINQLYFPLKRSELTKGESASKALAEHIKRAVEISIEQTTNLFLEHCQQAKTFHEVESHLMSINKYVPSIITKCQRYIKENLSILIRQFKEISRKHADVREYNLFIANITDIYLSELNVGEAKSAERKNLWQELHEQAKVDLIAILNKLKIANKQFAAGKLEAEKKLASYTGEHVELIALFKEFLSKSPARGYVSSIAQNYFAQDSQKSEIIHAYVLGLYNNYKNKLKLTTSKVILLKAVYQLNGNNIEFVIKFYLTKTLKQNLIKELNSFFRPTLTRHYELISDNPYAFYANLRLVNRSQKRNILNLKSALIQNDTVSRMWRLFDTVSADADVLESQEILNKSLGRKDLVEGLGNYEKVFEIICNIKSIYDKQEIQTDDKGIALLLRNIFLGNKISLPFSDINNKIILHKLQSIAYLIFGCECSRNPAMIVINQMLLDLIITSPDWTFESAFASTAPAMPMVAEGAVSAARSLETYYRSKMPHPYSYPGFADDTNVNALIHAESNIIRHWLLQVANVKTQSKIAQPPASWLLSLIQSHYGTWFGEYEVKQPKQNDLVKELKQ